MSSSKNPKSSKNINNQETSKNKFAVPKIQFSFNLTERQKQFTVVIISIILAGGITFGVAYFTNSNFRDSIMGGKQDTVTQINGEELTQSLNNLGQSLSKFNVDEILYENITLENLPVYPIAWVERYFTLSERQNALISGPAADPDKDGLSNKQEFLFGSSPRLADTLCLGKTDTPICKGKNDGENVAALISPLTGGTISASRVFRVSKQNSKLIENLQNSFENSSREGVDFPSLYQLSKEINLDDYYNSFKVIGVEDNRDSFGKYIEARTSIIQGFVDDSELNSLSEIYGTNDPVQLKTVRDVYQSRLDTLKAAPVPNRYVNTHKAYLSIFTKIIELVNFRIEGINKDTIGDETYKTDSKKLAVEVVWGYRKLSEEVINLGGK
jgi:hypothetical protein